MCPNVYGGLLTISHQQTFGEGRIGDTGFQYTQFFVLLGDKLVSGSKLVLSPLKYTGVHVNRLGLEENVYGRLRK